MAESTTKISEGSRNVTVNGKRVDLLAHPVHSGFSLFDAPALRDAALAAVQV